MEAEFPPLKRKREETIFIENTYQTAFRICTTHASLEDIEILRIILQQYGLSTVGDKKELCERIAQRLEFAAAIGGYQFLEDVTTFAHFQLMEEPLLKKRKLREKEEKKEEEEEEELFNILELLPDEIALQTMIFLPCRDLFKLIKMSKKLYALAKDEIERRKKAATILCRAKENIEKENLIECAAEAVRKGYPNFVEELVLYYCVSINDIINSVTKSWWWTPGLALPYPNVFLLKLGADPKKLPVRNVIKTLIQSGQNPDLTWMVQHFPSEALDELIREYRALLLQEDKVNKLIEQSGLSPSLIEVGRSKIAYFEIKKLQNIRDFISAAVLQLPDDFQKTFWKEVKEGK